MTLNCSVIIVEIIGTLTLLRVISPKNSRIRSPATSKFGTLQLYFKNVNIYSHLKPIGIFLFARSEKRSTSQNR